MEKESLKELIRGKGVYLVINSRIFPIDKDVISIGRRLENDVVIHDHLISRNHAEIRFEDDKFQIYDLDSTGGTFLNQKKITKSILYSGDIILLASVPIMFVDESANLAEPSEEETQDFKSK
jgi:pSer/pThr/pTyr-binding forkhead associated (FHA) protein